MKKIVVSRCLTGECCRYDGGHNLVPEIRELQERGIAVPVCPEQLGGLPTPRTPSEERDGRVVMRDGRLPGGGLRLCRHKSKKPVLRLRDGV